MIALLDVIRDVLNGFRDHMVAGGLADDVHDFEDRDAASDELGERPGKTGHGDFLNERAKNRKLQLSPVPHLSTALGPHKGASSDDNPGDGQDNRPPVRADKGA